MRFRVQLTLIRDMLGTNPCDPNVLDKHIIERQRKLILDKSKINSQVNKYLDAIQIGQERGDKEVAMLVDKLEELTGIALSTDERKKLLAGNLEDIRETFSTLETTGTTVFFYNKEKDRPCIGDHMVYGFLKAAGEALARTVATKAGTPLHSSSYTSSLINQHVRCEDEFLTFDQDSKKHEDGSLYFLQRSLRAMTAQGPRVALAKSEVVAAGAKLDFILNVLDGSPLIKAIAYKKGEEGPFHKIPLEHLFDYGQITGLGQWRNSGKGMFTYELSRLD